MKILQIWNRENSGNYEMNDLLNICSHSFSFDHVRVSFLSIFNSVFNISLYVI